MTPRKARCHCADIEIECIGEPTKVSMCHCLECQRRTGSAFSVAVFYERENIRLVRGEPRTFERPSASGFPVKFHFCPACGSNLVWEPARLPGRIGVAVGAFADPKFRAPDQSVWTKDKHHWLVLPPSTKAFEIR
jgi:hypothetical protein